MNIYKRLIFEILFFIVIIFGLDMISFNYLFFHVIVELFSIIIMFVLFVVTYNARNFINNRYLFLVGLSGFFIGVLDLLHTLTFYGMNIIPTDKYYANQFWVATRFFESAILFTGFIYMAQRKVIKMKYLLTIYSIITAAIILSIMVFEIFPVAYIKNVGQTHFKIYSEYIIIVILSCSLAMLVYNRKNFEKDTYILLLVSISMTILSEFCFTLYVANYDYVNKLGHIFKVLSFFMIYKANIANGFRKPIATFFMELKQSEQKIKEYSQELEKQIGTRNKFFSIISHDLKNPFTVLMGYSELLLKKHKEIDENTREQYISTIFESSKQTFNLLENLLTWSRTQTKTIPFDPIDFDIKEAIEKNLFLLSKNAEMKKINIKKEYASNIVYADKEMIITVVRNLVTNALKFTPKGGSIIIKTQEEQENIIISIEDTGIGMPEEKVKSLFQLDKTFSTKGTENESGTGLGLLLCYEFVTQNDGQIWVESQEGKGSKFSFSLKRGIEN